MPSTIYVRPRYPQVIVGLPAVGAVHVPPIQQPDVVDYWDDQAAASAYDTRPVVTRGAVNSNRPVESPIRAAVWQDDPVAVGGSWPTPAVYVGAPYYQPRPLTRVPALSHPSDVLAVNESTPGPAIERGASNSNRPVQLVDLSLTAPVDEAAAV